MINWKKGLASVAVVGLGFVLAACGGSNTEETSTSSAAGAGDDSTFTYAISGDPSSTNPINTSDRWGLTVTNMIYSPLVTVEADGTTQNALAESVEPAEDGLSLTVHLKQDVKWSDGEDFTADDVVFTYEQKVKKENGNADSLWVDDQPIAIEKVDEYTVKFVLPTPSAAAISNIATETYIIPEHIFKDVTDFSVSELPEKPVGTGPYQLKEYKRGEYFTFEANENYYGGKPSIQNVTLRIIESTDTAKVALQKGEVDAAVVLPSDIEDLDDE
ncbi:ABC transporter substrate-binding protein, partial [Listeria monocytogenes]|nr:ABC transporter substrate-binding protein [Listeria monocytogenes]